MILAYILKHPGHVLLLHPGELVFNSKSSTIVVPYFDLYLEKICVPVYVAGVGALRPKRSLRTTIITI